MYADYLVSEMTYNVLMGTLNPTHSLTHSLTHYADNLVKLCHNTVTKTVKSDITVSKVTV